MTACARLSPDGYHCSLERGHPGDHEARGMDGELYEAWAPDADDRWLADHPKFLRAYTQAARDRAQAQTGPP